MSRASSSSRHHTRGPRLVIVHALEQRRYIWIVFNLMVALWTPSYVVRLQFFLCCSGINLFFPGPGNVEYNPAKWNDKCAQTLVVYSIQWFYILSLATLGVHFSLAPEGVAARNCRRQSSAAEAFGGINSTDTGRKWVRISEKEPL